MASALSSVEQVSTRKLENANTESRRVVVKIRARARTDDLDTSWAKAILGLSENSTPQSRVFEYEEEGIVGRDFFDGEPLTTLADIERWQVPVFRAVTEWLRTKPSNTFHAIIQAGSSVDLFIRGHNGYIPLDSLREVVRLELKLLVVNST
jgi:hypothetical protein